jgi:DNA replication protein DnaC
MADELYNCTICKDAGMVHPRLDNGRIDYSRVVPCLCVQDDLSRAKRKRLFTWCELPAASEGMTLDTFRVSPATREAYEAACAVATGNLSWLALMSGVNRGKTHLAVGICRRWLELDMPARYAYVPLLLDEIRRGYQNGAGDYERRFDLFLNVPLLVLDDLGVEYGTPWVQEKLDTIIDYRLMHDLALVVTTNLSLPELPERIASRLNRKGRIVTMTGPEYSPNTSRPRSRQ